MTPAVTVTKALRPGPCCRILLYLWLLLMAGQALASVPVVRVMDQTDRVVLSTNISFIEDRSGTLSVASVLAGEADDQLFRITSDRANFGFTDAIYWLRFDLLYQSSQSGATRQWWIMADYALLDQVDVYLRDSQGRVTQLELGDDRPLANNALPITRPIFRLSTTAGEPVEVFIRVETQSSKLIGFDLLADGKLGQQLMAWGLISGSYYGVMLIMALYNLFIFFSIRDRAYLYYVAGIFSFVLTQAALDGLPWLFQIARDPVWYDRALPILMNTTWVWLMLFSRSFLRTRTSAPFIDKIIFFMALTAGWFAIMSTWTDYSTSIAVATRATLAFSFTLALIGVVLWRRGNRLARYYTLAWSAYMSGVALYIMYVFGVADYHPVVVNGIQVGAFCNVLLLGLALADRINMQKRETELARKRALRAKQDAQAASEQAQEHLQRFRQLYDNASEGIFQCTLDGRFISANPSLARTFGYASPQAMVDTVTNIAHQCYHNPEDRFRFEQQLMERKRVVDMEALCLRQDGSQFWGSSSAHVVCDKDGNPVYLEGSLIDITERKDKEKAQREREAAQASAQAKSDFLANMSHEIRTPMNAITGFADLALRTDLSPRQRGYVEKISHASSALLGIINDILDFSKIEAGKLDLETTEFSLHEVINDLVDMLSHKTAEKSLELSVSLARETPTALRGDPLRLGQILVNLTNNAIKFTEEGEIQVRINETRTLDNRSCLQFSVSDTGIGIPADKLGDLFSPFTQADGSTTRQYGGTGLGLSICKQLVEMMDGEIWVESTPGRGSVFHFTAWFELQPDFREKNIYQNKQINGLRVLLLDDRDAGQEALVEILTSFGCQTSVIQPDYRLIERLKSEVKSPSYDLVIVDRNLAAMRSLDAAMGIRQVMALSEVPIMLLALPNEDELIDEATECGFHPLIKPITPSVLLDGIQALFGYTGPSSSHRNQGSENADFGRLAGKRILLVEDTPFNQEIASEFLRDVDIKVRVAPNGEEALKQLAKHSIDAVLMDCQMPVMDGFEATRRIRNQLGMKALPIIAMTANAMKGDRQKCLDAGMNDYLTKPVDKDALYRTLLKWLPQTDAPAIPANSVPDTFDAIDTNQEPTPETSGVPLDRERALAQLGGNSKLLEQLLGQFLQEQHDLTDRLLEALDNEDRETAHRLAHTLKGMAASLAADALRDAAGALEDALARGAVSTEIERLVCGVDQALAALIDHLQPHHEESL